MKKTAITILFSVPVLLISGSSNNTANVNIDLGKSDIYSQEELESAADTIFNETGTWKCVKTVYSISCCGDEVSEKNLITHALYLIRIIFNALYLSPRLSSQALQNRKALILIIYMIYEG